MINGRRVATARGAILTDAAFAVPGELEPLFEPGYWADRGVLAAAGGRGSAWFIEHGTEQWVLRHYRRGGLMARVSEDRYLWGGERRVRAFAEYRLLAELSSRGLPVPTPLAARYERSGLGYRCDLIMRRIPGAVSLSAVLARGPLSESSWRLVGSAIARLHAAGVDHADLNAHNILVGDPGALDGSGAVSIVDFDRGRLREAGAWTGRNLSRLRRSLHKIAAGLPADRFSDESWRSLMEGYRA